DRIREITLAREKREVRFSELGLFGKLTTPVNCLLHASEDGLQFIVSSTEFFPCLIQFFPVRVSVYFCREIHIEHKEINLTVTSLSKVLNGQRESFPNSNEIVFFKIVFEP